MSASATPTSLARRIALRAGDFKDKIDLNLGNFIAASSSVVVGATLATQSVTTAHDTIAKQIPAGELMSFIPFIGTADIWITTVALVFCCVMVFTWPLQLVLEKTLLRKERSVADQYALVLTVVMCATIITFVAMHHLGDIANGLNWAIYQVQLHTVGFDRDITSVPDNVA